MIHIRRPLIVIGMVALVLALAGGTAFAAARLSSGVANVPSSPIVPTVTLVQGNYDGVGATETTDEGLTVTLTQLVKNGSRWLFHFQLKNSANTTLTVRGTGAVHQFFIEGMTQAAPPNNIGRAQLSSPSASEIATNYSDLATTLSSGGTAQGWLVVDTAHLDFTPVELVYQYAAVPALGCTNPADPSTCETDTLYQALDWYFF
jgi:hypothetical protein